MKKYLVKEPPTDMASRITSGISLILTLLSVVFWAATAYYAATFELPRALWGILFLGGCITIYVLSELSDTIKDGDWIDTAILSYCCLVTIITTAYMALNFQVLMTIRVAYALPHEYALAVAFIPAVTYLAWRQFGRVFLFMVVGMILYGFYGWMIPGILGHGGLTWTRILQISMLEIDGVYGSLTTIVAAWVALFLLYAGFLSGYGAFEIIVRSALRTTKYIRSGVAQTAVVASTIIGSINGSRTANAAMTGSITIPMMKDVGLSPELAAGIEADASSLGQILPPVMGSAGFLMASFLGISYAEVMVGATIPALILIGSIGIAVHYRSVNQVPNPQIDLEQQLEESLERKQLVVEVTKFVIPFIILVYLLGIARVTVPTAALYTCIAMVSTGIGFPLIQGIYTSENISEFSSIIHNVLSDTLEGLTTGASVLAPVAIIVAAINLVIDLLLATGVPSAVTLAMMALSGGLMIVAVIIAMAIGVILGMGMPTVAAYTIVAILIAPTFINAFGVPAMGAHFFALYAALLSGITPPIASAVAVTSGIASANFLKSCWEAIRLYAPVFIIPATFLYHPEIVSSSWTPYTFIMGGIVFLGAISIIYGLNFTSEDDYWSTSVLPTRIGFTVIGVFIMVHPVIWIQLSGIVIIAILFAISRLNLRQATIDVAKRG